VPNLGGVTADVANEVLKAVLPERPIPGLGRRLDIGVDGSVQFLYEFRVDTGPPIGELLDTLEFGRTKLGLLFLHAG